MDTTFTKWKSGEPNNSGEKDCGVMNGDDADGKWSAQQCGLKFPFVCEKGGQNLP